MNRVRAVLPFVLVLVGTAVLADAATVATPTFDKKHGFYDSGFSVRISTGTAGATIRYTTDGSKPTASYGTVLANGGTVSIGTTTCLRAVGCAGGMTTSRILTQTYIFLNDVIKQKRPSGYPSAFGTVAGDYDMDPDIVNNSSYSGTIKDDLKAIPSLSLVAGKNEWFGTGFFNGGGGSGGQNTKEIGVSAELIYADSRPGFQIDAGLKTHSWARSKRSLRLLFKTTYGGPSTLNYPFFESAPHHSGSAANTFGKIFLRGGGNDCWTGGWYTDGRDVTYIKDQWARDTQTALSGSGSRGTFMHLYINGLYWGLYNPVERPDARFAATYFGGSKGDYFAGNQGSDSFGAVSGSESRFTYMINTLAKQDLSVAANYDKMKQYLDLNHYIDYIITWWYMGGGDWVEGNQPNYSYQYVNNYYVGNRNSGPVKYYIWDGETAWVDSSGTSRPGRMNAGAWVKPQFVEYYSDSKHHWMARPFRALWKNKDFRDLWAQRVYQHCYNGGALTDANARARWSTLASRVDKAMVAESARWGDHKRDYSNSSCPVFNRNTHFRNARNYVLGLMSGNVDRFIKALRAKSLHGYPLYPATHPGGSAPSAPSSLAASATSSTAVTLTWQDNSSNETAFKIDRSTDGSTWSRIKETGSNVTTYTDSGLAAGQKYYYRVKASNSVGDSGYSNVASATTSQNVPAAPSGATASATSSTAITITWTDNSSNETGFKLDRRQSGTDAWVRITQTGANVTRYTDSGLSAGTQYYYMVKATSSAGDSDYSNVAAATTAEGLPAQPSGVAATALSTTQIKLTWQDNSSNETQFKIRRSLDGVDFDTLEPVYAAANATTLTDSGLTPGTTYSYKMRSENAAGVSAYTTPVSATTQLGVPAAPSDLTATAASASRVDLTWKDSSSNETGFKLDRRQSGTDSWVRIAEPAAGTTAYSDTGLAAGTHYYYMVKAYNAAGNSAYSGVAAATTDEGLPAQPAGVAAAAVSETEIRLTWTDTSSNETQFKIRRSLDGIDFYVLDPLYAAADATSVTDSGLTPGTTYHYMMRSENAAGVSAYTTPVSATTQLGVPAAPSGLTATAVSSSGIDLSWTDSSSNETAFKIDRRESGTTLWVRVAEPAAGVTGYSDVGLPADTHFYYKVKASNSAGDSAYSSVAAATTEAAGGPEPKIEKGSTWRYRKGTAEASARPEMWRSSGFDDSGWSTGSAPFGYGGLSYGTKLADMRNSYSCLFLRKTFAVTDPALVTRLEVDVDYDDGFILWINGHEVARVNVQGAVGEPVAYDETCAGYVSAGTAAWTVALNGGGLPELGTVNVAAVQLFNNSIGSGDAIFDAGVSVVLSQLPVADDADQDVLPDDWETDQLGGTGESADGDKDGDGVSNLEEYIAGTDPSGGSSYFEVDVTRSGAEITVSFSTVAASGAGYEGKTRHYALERCTGASAQATWTAVPGYENIVGTGQTVTYTNTAPDARTFFRGRVWLAE